MHGRKKHQSNNYCFSTANNRYANAPQCCIYTYIACLVFSCWTQLVQCNRWRKVSRSGDKLMCCDVTGNLLPSKFVVSFRFMWKLNDIISRLLFCHVTPCSLVDRNQLYIPVRPYSQHSPLREPDLTQ